MGKIRLDIPHTLDKAEAKRRVEKLLAYWSSKYGLTAQWMGDAARLTGKVMGISLEADLAVHDGKVDGEATDPGFLLRDQAKKYLTQKLNQYLDPGKSPGELG